MMWGVISEGGMSVGYGGGPQEGARGMRDGLVAPHSSSPTSVS